VLELLAAEQSQVVLVFAAVVSAALESWFEICCQGLPPGTVLVFVCL